MTDRQDRDLLKRFANLPPTGKRKILEFLRFLEEKARPQHAQEVDVQEQEYIADLTKVLKMQEILGLISAEVVNFIRSALPKAERALLAEFKSLTYSNFLAQEKPYRMFNERGPDFKLAKESTARALETLAKLKEKRTEGGRDQS